MVHRIFLHSFLIVQLLAFVPIAGAGSIHTAGADNNGNGREDVLDSWQKGHLSWQDLRQHTRHSRSPAVTDGKAYESTVPAGLSEAEGNWNTNQIRIISLGGSRGELAAAGLAAGQTGHFEVLHDLMEFGGVRVMALDEAALEVFLGQSLSGRLVLDRDGLPALANSRWQVGADQVQTGHWQLGQDWSATLAILDSGCDTAHGDLGDFSQDNVDGPPPSAGDPADWYPADNGWPLFQGYKVVGWIDVSDDIPQAQGPWDYHHHGTALASVVAGSGNVQEDQRGMNPGGRLTVVKYYDYDGVWHAWAGDYLAACAWTLANRDVYRIRAVLSAVNWEADLGLSQAMADFVDAGITPIVAMGNFGDDPAGPGYPASLADVLTVGSMDADGSVSAFSGRGLSGQAKPDLLAPGGAVVVADNEPNDTYSQRQGTSLGAAHVAGALFLLDEALIDNGIHLPPDRTSVLTKMALLRATCGRIDQAADPVTGNLMTLPSHNAPDQHRGWGGLRIDAAVQAVLQPLFPGNDQTDTLSVDFARTSCARRLVLSPGVRYLVEAVPQAGLDVSLDIIEPRMLDTDPAGNQVLRTNDNGSGVSEFVYYHPQDEDWTFLVVRRVSGSGEVLLRIQQADSFSQPALEIQLPGNLTGAPQWGRLGTSATDVLVVPSRVEVDFVARSVNIFDGSGQTITGWPVFVFPHPSANGGLSAPVVWDLDGQEGDEIVLGSDFGSVYFFNQLGSWFREDLGLNIRTTAPVGVEDHAGDRKISVVDDQGNFRTWSWGPVLEAEVDLGHLNPLDLAAGQLSSQPGQEIVTAFADGTVFVTDTEGAPLAGWPVDLGSGLEVAPVLCDLDEDGLHEIILPDLDFGTGILRMHVLHGDGQPGPGHGQLVSAPEGGQWLQISQPVVAGRYGTADLRVSVLGLTKNSLTGVDARWHLALGSLYANGSSGTQRLPGLQISGTTSQGSLTLQNHLLPPPLAYDFLGGTGTEVAAMFSLEWTEILYGLTAIDGSCAARFAPHNADRPLEGRTPLQPGGSLGVDLSVAAGAMLNMGQGVLLEARALNDLVHLLPVLAGHDLAPCWGSARADGRNSGAYPLRSTLTPALDLPEPAESLVVYPNPGSSNFQFRLSGGVAAQPLTVSIYDLRGRLINSLRNGGEETVLAWDGLDNRGRPAAAGTYLAVSRRGNTMATRRFVITR